jgi:hypothetical protein
LATSSIPNYPEELLINGRSPDEIFEADELLFYRAPKLDERGKIGSVDVICPNTSVNRGKYSKPIHTLYCRFPQFINWFVLEIRVGDVPKELQSGDGKKLQFFPVHDPTPPPEENYAHAEIRALLEQQPKKRWSALVEKQFRQILADRMQLVPPDRMNP